MSDNYLVRSIELYGKFKPVSAEMFQSHTNGFHVALHWCFARAKTCTSNQESKQSYHQIMHKFS
jgi:hypothetical protein